MNLADALKNVSEAEARAIYAALAQYVENGQCNGEIEESPYEDELLAPAESALERMDEFFAKLADQPS